MITSIDADITYEGMCAEMKDICKFDELQPFTVKWLDEEGMPDGYHARHLMSSCLVHVSRRMLRVSLIM